jgi:hypothetical protein
LEESTVATPWSPGTVGASIVDAGGVQIDGSRGGLFRYRGRDGGVRSIVEGGAKGLVFGGDTELWSPKAGTLLAGSKPLGGTYPNLLANGGFKYGTHGWYFNQNGDPVARFEMWEQVSDWTLFDGDTYNGQGGSSARLVSSRLPGEPFAEPYISHDFPAVAGLPYSMSALIGNHRMPGGRISLWFFDRDGNLINSADQPLPTEPKGGQWYGGWGRVDINGHQAPPGTVRGAAVLVGGSPFIPDGASTDWYLMMDQVMVTQSDWAVPYQVTPPDYLQSQIIRAGRARIAANAGFVIVNFGYTYIDPPVIVATPEYNSNDWAFVETQFTGTPGYPSAIIYLRDHAGSVVTRDMDVAWMTAGDR